MSLRRRCGRLRAVVLRVGAVGLAVLAIAAPGSPAVAADPVPTVALDPPEVMVLTFPTENFPGVDAASVTSALASSADTSVLSAFEQEEPPAAPADAAAFLADVAQADIVVPDDSAASDSDVGVAAESEAPDFAPVEVAWGGAAVLHLPPWMDLSDAEVVLELYPDVMQETPTRTYSTATPGPDLLTVTELAPGEYSVALPPDDLANGPLGVLSVQDIPDVDGVGYALPPFYILEFTGGGALVQDLEPGVVALGSVPCGLAELDEAGSCLAASVEAGSPVRFTVPSESLLRTLGFPGLDTMTLDMLRLSADGEYLDEEAGVTPTDDPGAVTLASPYDATVTLPADVPAGSYEAFLTTGDEFYGAVTFLSIDVTATEVPESDVTTAPDRGLRSDTGWTQTPSDAGSGPLVALGADGGGLRMPPVLRPTRRSAALAGCALTGLAGVAVLLAGLDPGVPSGVPGSSWPAAPTTAAPPTETPSAARASVAPGSVPPARYTPSSAVRLEIPAVDVDLPLLGLAPRGGTIDPPLLTAGYWIEAYGEPVGAAGDADDTLFIAAHSAGAGADGFDPLLAEGGSTLARGDEVRVRTPQGTVSYTVERTQRYAKEELAAADEVWEAAPGRLVLITCFQEYGGPAATENLVVIAES